MSRHSLRSPNRQIKPLAYAVSMIFLSMGTNVVAQTCPISPPPASPATTVITGGTITSPYIPIANGDCLEVTATGGINASSGGSPASAVFINQLMPSVTNNGNIQSLGGFNAAIMLRSAGEVTTITNNGTLFGSSYGILVISNPGTHSVGEIANNSMISGGHGYGIQVSLNNTVDKISNSAGSTIQGSVGIAVHNNSSVTTITNDGTISGIDVSVGSIVNLITNTGTISGPNFSIKIVDNSTQINNSGLLDGAVNLGTQAILTLDGNSARVTGNVTGTNASEVSINGTFTSENTFNVPTLNIGASSVFNLNHNVTANQLTNQGIVNNTAVLASAVDLATQGILNLNGSAARVTGPVTGTNAAAVNINGTFTSENTFNVPTLNIGASSVFNLNHNVTTGSGGFNNQGLLAVAAGNTATITGNYTQSGAGVYQTGVSASQYGKLMVNGDADLQNGKLDVLVTTNDTLTNNKVLTDILKATGTLTTTDFNVTDNSAMWDFIATLNGSSIDLTTQQISTITDAILDTGASPAGLGAAGAIDAINQSGTATGDLATVINAMNALPTQTAVADAVEQLKPVMSGGAAQVNINQASTGGSRVVRNYLSQAGNAAIASISGNSGLSAGDHTFKDQMAWVQPFGAYTRQQDQDGVTGYKARSTGIAGGIDAKVRHNWRVGGALSYGQGNVNESTSGGNQLRIDTYQATIYGTHTLDERTYLNLMGALGFDRNNSRRPIQYTGVNRVANASYNAWHTYLNSEIGRNYVINPKTTITPSLSLEYTYVDVESYTETGANSVNLNVNSQNADALVLAIGTKLTHAPREDLRMTGHAALGYDALTEQSSLTSTFSGGGPAFITEGIKPSSTVLRAGLGLKMLKKIGSTISANYDVEAREHYTDQVASVNFRFLF